MKKNDVIRIDNKYNEFNYFKQIAIFYTLIMGLFQFADKLYGATFMVKMNSQGLSLAMISILLAFHEIIIVISDYPSGVISDYFGRKKIAGISLILFGIGVFLFANASSIVMYIIAFLLLALATALFSGSPQSWFYDTMTKLKFLDLREKILPFMSGVVTFFAVCAAGIAIFLTKISIKWPLYLSSGISIVCGILLLTLFIDNKGNNKQEKLLIIFKEFSVNFLKDCRMRTIVYTEITSYVGYSVFILIWQIVLINKYGFNEEYIGALLIGVMIMIMLGNLLTGLIAKKITLFNTTYLGKVLVMISFVLLIITRNLYVTIILFALYEFGQSLVDTSSSIWHNDYISCNNRSSYYSAISSVRGIFGALIILLVGMSVDSLGYSTGWLIAAIFELISIVFLYFFIKKYKNMIEADEDDMAA